MKLCILPPRIWGFLGKVGIKVEIDICVIFKKTISVIFNYMCAFKIASLSSLPLPLSPSPPLSTPQPWSTAHVLPTQLGFSLALCVTHFLLPPHEADLGSC